MAAAVYVAIVLSVDVLAISGLQQPFSWSVFRWVLGDQVALFNKTVFDRFDLFKFVFWFIVPVCVALPRMDWHYLIRAQWTRWDAAFVGGLAAIGMAAMFLIPLVPELQKFYPSLSAWPVEMRIQFFLTRLVWIASWLVGWEFMHRYFLLRQVQPIAPDWSRPRDLRQWGWLLVPLLETGYHLHKAALEAAGMFFFSAVLTWWCLKRGNWLIAFLVHLIIEVELLLFLTLIA